MKLIHFALALALLAPAGHAAAPASDSGSTGATTAAALTRDLGRNLYYHRVRTLPADLPAATRKQPCVLDLRYVRADDEAAAELHAWIKSHASARTPVFVLANSDTDRDLVAPLTGRSAAGSVLVIGAAGRNFSPDIAVEISPANERRAYDALAAGTELSLLLTENPDKVRNDEASLSRDQVIPSTAPGADAASAKKAESPPIDAALQRAVHLHRTLVALRRI